MTIWGTAQALGRRSAEFLDEDAAAAPVVSGKPQKRRGENGQSRKVDKAQKRIGDNQQRRLIDRWSALCTIVERMPDEAARARLSRESALAWERAIPRPGGRAGRWGSPVQSTLDLRLRDQMRV